MDYSGDRGWRSRGGRGNRRRPGSGRGRYWGDRKQDGAWGSERSQDRDDYGGSMSAGKAKYSQRHKRDHSEEKGGRERPPPGLRGREIGLWYASRQKGRTKDQQKQNTPQITIDSQQERHLTNLLANIQSSEACPPQPSRSYKDPFEDDEEDMIPTSPHSASHSHRQLGHAELERSDEIVYSNQSDVKPSSHSGRNSKLFSYMDRNRATDNQDSMNNQSDRNKFSQSGSSYSTYAPRNSSNVHCETQSSQSNSRNLSDGRGGSSSRQYPADFAINRSEYETPSGYASRNSSLFDSDTPRAIGSSSGENPSQNRSTSASKHSPTSLLSGDFISLKAGDNAAVGMDSADSDSDVDDEKLYRMAQELEQTYQMGNTSLESPEFGAGQGGDEEDEPLEQEAMFDLGLYEKEDKNDSEFLFQFLKHNAENKRSMENLSELNPAKAVSLQRDPALDRQLLRDHKEKQQQPRFKEMMAFRKKLPSFKMQDKILDVIQGNQVVVLSGETGCGKTTQVSQFILDDYIERGDGSLCRIVCTQPRRISAISVAERVADERTESCGTHTVGYQIRLESRLPKKQGSILYCTTGIMLKWLESDPLLSGTSHFILDEIHERDLHSDFLMIILRDLLPRRPDLKLVLMSATLNAEMFSQYYDGCPMINIPGFTFPVKEFLLEDTVQLIGYRGQSGTGRQPMSWRKTRQEKQEQQEYLEYCDSLRNRQVGDVLKTLDNSKVNVDLCAELALYIIKHKPIGAVLIFVPGWTDIKAVNDGIEQRLARSSISKSSVRLIPLHSLMPTVNQKEVFQRPPEGVRKIIIATNIAETSITIDDIVYVIDCGKIKLKNFDAENNVQTLMAQWVSHANAKQRRGRAGRVQAGECYHLYSAFHESRLQDYQLPEMLRTRLEELCLMIKILKLGMVEPFVQKAIQPPSMEALKQSLNLLRDLNALDQYEDLTPLGYHLAKMPVDPHSGKMLLYGAMFSCVDPIMTIAASLSFKDAFYIPMGKEKIADAKRRELASKSQSDHIMLVNAYKGWERAKHRGTVWQYCRENFLSSHTLQMLSDMRRQFGTILQEMKFMESSDPKCPSANRNSGNIRLVKAIVCAGLFPNVACVVKVKPPHKEWQATKLTTKTDRAVVFHPKSVNASETEFTSQWVVYHLKMKINKICLFDSTVVSPLSLLFYGGELVVKHERQEKQDPDLKFVDIGGHVTLKANQKTCHLVQNLRREFDSLLEYKITHPGCTNWDKNSKEGALLKAIVELIATEREQPPDFRRGRDRGGWNRTCGQCGEKGHSGDRCRLQDLKV